jgi:hypothetical protein
MFEDESDTEHHFCHQNAKILGWSLFTIKMRNTALKLSVESESCFFFFFLNFISFFETGSFYVAQGGFEQSPSSEAHVQVS